MRNGKALKIGIVIVITLLILMLGIVMSLKIISKTSYLGKGGKVVSSSKSNQLTNSQSSLTLGQNSSLQNQSTAEEQAKVPRQKMEDRWYGYDTDVELNGVVEEKSGYGPPNYGETPEEDEKVTYYVLALNEPVNVKGDPKNFGNEESFEKVKYIQITVLSDEDLKKVESLLGKQVIIKCKLYQKSIAPDYTDVILQFSDILGK